MNDTFYTSNRVGDLCRVPLLKPVELISADEGFTWFVRPLFGGIKGYKSELGEITKIGINDSIIVAYLKRVYMDSKMTEAWVVLDVAKRKIYAFTEFVEYALFLQGQNFQSIKLFEVISVYESFVKKKEQPFDD